MALFSVKMRSSAGGTHISGAERIVEERGVPNVCAAMGTRALAHGKGKPDSITVTVTAIDGEVAHIPALPITEAHCADPAEARETVIETLAPLTPHAVKAWELLTGVRDMRGAILFHAATGARLEPDHARGVRVTSMDAATATGERPEAHSGKTRVTDALVLASKVAHHPAVLAEVCISDDPDYTTGYVASREMGYLRVPNIKPGGSPLGGRLFVVDTDDPADLIDYLEHTPVLVGETK
ncbi:6-carboxyhexanoate--CoA ligase [Corynebacterium faecium]|uniref:6-carboxyhexanoate--CoA ligase n=1 Tax=Corynebacterium faecium TaxID=3016001 RepID=UPI0022B536E3|nr:6-carboxyhexanoate--CoA ligase [Corynebacterium faecium]